MENLHKFFSGDRLAFDQECGYLVQCFPVFAKHLFCLLVRLFQHLHHFVINLSCCCIATVQSCTAVQILMLHTRQSHQSELFRHAVLGDHRFRNLRSFFNIIRCSGCYIPEYHFFCSTTTKETYQHRFQLRFGIQIFFFFRYLHDISECSHGPRYNRNLLHRLRILLQCTYQCMTHLMVRNDPTFFLTENTILLFFTDQDNFHCFIEIFLRNGFSSVLYSKNGCLIDHIGKIRSYCSGSRQCNRIQIHGFIQ